MGTGKIIQADNINGLKVVKNFISNGLASLNTSGWATYKDAAGTRPVDGTGGSPTLVSFSRTTTSPLDDAASFLFTVAGSSSAQGEGASFNFTIDSAYKAKVLKIELDYIVNSGTFVAGSNTTDSDVIIYLYDVTNAVLIEPSSFKFLSNSTTITDKFQGTFQTASNSTSYRLIFHVASTSTAAYSLKFDNISVSPSQYVYGTPITDWQSYTPVMTGTTTNPTIGDGTITGRWRRVGDSIEVSILATSGTTTTPGSGEYRWSLPSGIAIDAAKLNRSAATIGLYDTNSNNKGYVALAATGSLIRIVTADSFSAVGQNFPSANWFSAAAGRGIFINATFAVQGWSSSVQMSDGYDGRQVVLKAGSVGIAYPGTGTSFKFATAAIDTLNSYNPTTGNYTILTSGNYRVGFTLNLGIGASTTGQYVNAGIYVNGSLVDFNTFRVTAGTADINMSASFIMSLKAGETVFVGVSATNATLSASSNSSYFQLEKLSGSPTISATETVAAKYTNTAGTSITSGTTSIPFATKSYDTHGAWSSDRFTAPIYGIYSFKVNLYFASASFTSTTKSIYLLKNGTTNMGYLATITPPSASTYEFGIGGSIDVELNAGEYIEIKCQHNESARNLSTVAGTNVLSISKVK